MYRRIFATIMAGVCLLICLTGCIKRDPATSASSVQSIVPGPPVTATTSSPVSPVATKCAGPSASFTTATTPRSTSVVRYFDPKNLVLDDLGTYSWGVSTTAVLAPKPLAKNWVKLTITSNDAEPRNDSLYADAPFSKKTALALSRAGDDWITCGTLVYLTRIAFH